METPGEQLIGTLDELRLKLLQLKDRLTQSGVERTNGLGCALGRDCGYYQRSLSKFIDKDYIDLRNLVNQAASLFKVIEGPNE